ncbi:MAG TPA: hypothetical protein PLW44_11750, partial [Chitinophagales bacterium]|nr:hypothetical protein [Chitinophagales bacterium]
MKNCERVVAVALVTVVMVSCSQKAAVKLKYPETKKTDVTDEYFGTKVADPYRWLEDDNSKET